MLVFSVFLGTVVPSNVYAVTVNEYEMTKFDETSPIEEVFQMFQYTMVVEWDQKDEAFKNQAEQDLVNALLAYLPVYMDQSLESLILSFRPQDKMILF